VDAKGKFLLNFSIILTYSYLSHVSEWSVTLSKNKLFKI
jgi:hypothetical protein